MLQLLPLTLEETIIVYLCLESGLYMAKAVFIIREYKFGTFPSTLHLLLLSLNNYLSLFLAKLICRLTYFMYVCNFIVCCVKGTAEKQ